MTIRQKHIVSYSGGVGSFFAAKRLTEKHGANQVLALFADTLIEDQDLYRFLDETIAFLGIEIVKIADGRTPWQVFHDKRFLGNSRVDPCSHVLKRDLIRKWQKDNLDPNYHVINVGIDWSEIHRLERLQARSKTEAIQWQYEAPLCEKPFVNKEALLGELKRLGIKVPRLYTLGFPHNNCGGFCVKAGQAQFAKLLKEFPERYAFHEKKEKELQAYLQKPVTIMRKMVKGKKQTMSLQQFRESLQKQQDLFDKDEWGGCGCALD